MFRKIPSKPDPGETVFAQISKEFAPYFKKTSAALTLALNSKPKLALSLMLTAITLSAGLSFTIFRHKAPVRQQLPKVRVISDGFDQLSSAAAAIRQTIRLKQQIDSLSAKKTLSKQDSGRLENELDQLHQLNQYSRP